MTDSLATRGTQDRVRINMNQEHEVKYWTDKFDVSREELQRAVDKVGPMVDAVERQLRRS